MAGIKARIAIFLPPAAAALGLLSRAGAALPAAGRPFARPGGGLAARLSAPPLPRAPRAAMRGELIVADFRLALYRAGAAPGEAGLRLGEGGGSRRAPAGGAPAAEIERGRGFAGIESRARGCPPALEGGLGFE